VDRDRLDAAALVDRADGDTLDPFVLRRDKRLAFSPDRTAAVGYRYLLGVGLAAADPVGDPVAATPALREFLALADRLGWRPAVMGARADGLSRYEALGLHGIYLGDEAIVDVPRFTLTGRRMRNVRQAVSRTRNSQIRTEIHREGELSPALRADLLAITAAQRGAGRELGFSMTLGSLFSGDHPHCLVVVAREHGGRPVAFQRYVPCRAGGALSLDVMRRLPDAPNGVHERMIVDTLGWARRCRVAAISLNFVAFREKAGGATERATAWLARRLDGHFGIQMESLRRFNAKFQPAWVPRCLIYRSFADLPAIGLAILSAEGFLPLDRGRERLARSSNRQGDAVG
jgi:lysyl-tRNA synthetase class 2